MAAALEKPFIDAIEAKEIESVLLAGKDITGIHSYSKVFGNRIPLSGAPQPLESNDILFLASCTKLLTAVAALQCVERGQLSLHSPAALPSSLTSLGILRGYGGDTPTIEPNTKPITLAHLLTHSSGLAYEFFSPHLKQWRKANPAPSPARDVPEIMTTPLIFAPGEGWMYGPGVDWVGVLVEQVSGMQLDEYFRKHILEPLGISPGELSFRPVKEGLGDRMVDLTPKDPKGLGMSVCGGDALFEGVEACMGGGGAYIAGKEYVRILWSLLADDGKLLGKEMRKEMFKGQLEDGAKQATNGLMASEAGAFFGQGTSGPGKDFGFGGMYVGQDGDGGMGEGTLTWGGGINSAWFIDPKNGVCGFAAPQLGMPPNVMKATALKAVFRNEMNIKMLKSIA